MSTGLQILLLFKVVFQHECHLLNLSVNRSLKWARFGIIIDLYCYRHQSSCFALRQSLAGLAITLSLVFLWVCLFHFGYRQEIRLSHSEKRL